MLFPGVIPRRLVGVGKGAGHNANRDDARAKRRAHASTDKCVGKGARGNDRACDAVAVLRAFAHPTTLRFNATNYPSTVTSMRPVARFIW